MDRFVYGALFVAAIVGHAVFLAWVLERRLTDVLKRMTFTISDNRGNAVEGAAEPGDWEEGPQQFRPPEPEMPRPFFGTTEPETDEDEDQQGDLLQ